MLIDIDVKYSLFSDFKKVNIMLFTKQHTAADFIEADKRVTSLSHKIVVAEKQIERLENKFTHGHRSKRGTLGVLMAAHKDRLVKLQKELKKEEELARLYNCMESIGVKLLQKEKKPPTITELNLPERVNLCAREALKTLGQEIKQWSSEEKIADFYKNHKFSVNVKPSNSAVEERALQKATVQAKLIR